MFSSNSLDKNCVGLDNCSSGRNNANRFPVGMTSLGEENQQIRIQLAVHKYNSTNNQLSNRCSTVSPVRHSYLKNSLKAKNFEGDPERTSKSDKKNENKYEGVGAFPTIHLKKSAVRYRPIRRFNDVKIPYPELPVNRFLTHSSEVNLDIKSTARSVLDVLEDLSGKKIHLNEEKKPKVKGLGGDYLSNSNAVYKPLFVQKSKISSILTKDNTTQTLSSVDTGMASPQSSNSFTRNDAVDPRAELRRKLAKQNNEIFASLSSSISSSFTLKRKIEKVLPTRDDDHLIDGSVTKKSKISDHQYKNSSKSNLKTVVKSKSDAKSSDSMKSNRKSNQNEANSPTSPNKDRLTTIFLDMQNTSPRAQIFENSATEFLGKTTSENGLGKKTNLSNGFENNSQASVVNKVENKSSSSAVSDFSNTNTSDSNLKNSSSIGFAEKIDSRDSKNDESELQNHSVLNFPVSKDHSTQNDISKSISTGFQLKSVGTNTSYLSFQKASVKNNSVSSEISSNVGNESSAENKGNCVLVPSKPFTSANSNDKPDFSSFKFGAVESASLPLNTPTKDKEPPKSKISEVLPVATTTSSSTALPLQFGTTATFTSPAPLPSTAGFGSNIIQNMAISPAKPLFTFGQIASVGQQTKVDEKAKTFNAVSTTVTDATQTIQSSAFQFGQKLSPESSSEINSDKNVATLSVPANQSNSFPSAATTTSTILVTDSAVTTQSEKTLFTFGKKTETSTTSSAPIASSKEQNFVFSFGEKPDTGQSKSSDVFGQKVSNLFSFGQKPTTQESNQSTTVAANGTSPSQLPTTQSTSLFGQNVSQTTDTSQGSFGQPSASQHTTTYGVNLDEKSYTTPGSGQSNIDFPVEAPTFASSSGGFGTVTTQASNGIGTTTSSASSFKFGPSATTQSTSTFGVSSAPQTVPVFGVSSESSPLTGFGSSSTTQSSVAFGASAPNTTHAFGISRQPPFTFGISSTTQSTPTFGNSSATQSSSTFGISSTAQSTVTFRASSTSLTTSGFGVTSTTQSASAFGGSPRFGAPSSQPNTVFGTLSSTQSPLRFGTATSQSNSSFGASTGFSTSSTVPNNNSFGVSTATSTAGFGASQPSFSQSFDSKPPATSLGQTSSIFGQTPVPSFSSTTPFNSNQNNIFGSKPNTEGSLFDQNKIQTPGFGATGQPFAAQNKFSFGMATSSATGFTNPLPNTTTTPVFSFGSNPPGNTFTFGSNSSGSVNTQTPFVFKSPTSEPFKFGASAAKDGSGFGGANTNTNTNTSAFTFTGQINNNTISEQKPSFNFGSAQVSSSSPFNFGTTSAPSVFSFGGSTSSASSGSNFNFGTPTPGGLFCQGTASPGATFSVPGTFNIGSGSSQSRPRATSRPRRRP